MEMVQQRHMLQAGMYVYYLWNASTHSRERFHFLQLEFSKKMKAQLNFLLSYIVGYQRDGEIGAQALIQEDTKKPSMRHPPSALCAVLSLQNENAAALIARVRTNDLRQNHQNVTHPADKS